MTHIKTRYGTSGAWTSENPVLLAGEKGVESNTGKIKIGDGTTAWNSLNYSSVPPASPAFTGTPTAPTPAGGDNSTKIATTQFVQAELAGKASLASPVFTGTPTAPNPPTDDDDTSLATTAWVNDAIATAVADAIAGLDPVVDPHPIGSIHISVNPANPSTYFGGTWVAHAVGRMLIGLDSGDTDFDTVEETGGAKTHDHDLDTTSSGARVRVASDQFLTVVGKTGPTRAATQKFDFGANNGSASSLTTAFMVALEGQSSVESNLPPFSVVYIWKRTA